MGLGFHGSVTLPRDRRGIQMSRQAPRLVARKTLFARKSTGSKLRRQPINRNLPKGTVTPAVPDGRGRP
jgi:GTP cyclohydrolase FolE2